MTKASANVETETYRAVSICDRRCNHDHDLVLVVRRLGLASWVRPPIPWVTTPPELVEKIVTVLLSRENEHAHRIRPSRVDGRNSLVAYLQ